MQMQQSHRLATMTSGIVTLIRFHLTVQGLPGLRVRLESSTDLRTWQLWTNILIDPDPLPLIDDRSDPRGLRFYRGVAD
jgi:hypothetical protein